MQPAPLRAHFLSRRVPTFCWPDATDLRPAYNFLPLTEQRIWQLAMGSATYWRVDPVRKRLSARPPGARRETNTTTIELANEGQGPEVGVVWGGLQLPCSGAKHWTGVLAAKAAARQVPLAGWLACSLLAGCI